MQDVRRARDGWLATPAPCGISHEDIYNPCLPEPDDGRLWCVTCGFWQRLQLKP
jgi:hypothetical protein